MFEVMIGAFFKGLGAVLLGYLLVAVVRLFSRSGARSIEYALHLPTLEKKPAESEPLPIAAPVSQGSEATSVALSKTDDEAARLAVLQSLHEYARDANGIRTLPVKFDPSAPHADLLSDGDLSSGQGPLKK